MSPVVIFLCRFVIAYAGVWFFCPKRLFAANVKDEFCFIAWNWALSKIGIVRATNLLYAQCFFTMVFAAVILGEKITLMAVVGTAILVAGMFIALRKSFLKTLSLHI